MRKYVKNDNGRWNPTQMKLPFFDEDFLELDRSSGLSWLVVRDLLVLSFRLPWFLSAFSISLPFPPYLSLSQTLPHTHTNTFFSNHRAIYGEVVTRATGSRKAVGLPRSSIAFLYWNKCVEVLTKLFSNLLNTNTKDAKSQTLHEMFTCLRERKIVRPYR